MPTQWGTPSARGSRILLLDGHIISWALCHTPECPYTVCRRLSETKCYKHADSLSTLEELIEQVNGVGRPEGDSR